MHGEAVDMAAVAAVDTAEDTAAVALAATPWCPTAAVEAATVAAVAATAVVDSPAATQAAAAAVVTAGASGPRRLIPGADLEEAVTVPAGADTVAAATVAVATAPDGEDDKHCLAN